MERVLVVEREKLEKILPSGPFISENIEEIINFILKNYTFEDREKAEYDTNLKQIIPYIVIRQENRFYMLKRLQKQTEKRLHNMLSLGVGGHINPGESEENSILEAGLHRELREEVFVEHIRGLSCVGIIDDNSGGVSNFHLGVFYLLDAEGEVHVLETEKMKGRWASMDELEEQCQYFERWSQIVIQSLQTLF